MGRYYVVQACCRRRGWIDTPIASLSLGDAAKAMEMLSDHCPTWALRTHRHSHTWTPTTPAPKDPLGAAVALLSGTTNTTINFSPPDFATKPGRDPIAPDYLNLVAEYVQELKSNEDRKWFIKAHEVHKAMIDDMPRGHKAAMKVALTKHLDAVMTAAGYVTNDNGDTYYPV